MARSTSPLFIILLALLFNYGLLPSVVHAAQSSEIAVIYPKLEEPYRGIFSAIIEGIQDQSQTAIKLLPVRDGDDGLQLRESIDPEHTATVIALGKTGLAAADQWKGKIPIVVGALLLTPDKKDRGLVGISLAPDPEIIFSRLKQIAPSVKRVHVVYSSESSEWLIKIARDSINTFNLQLLAYKSDDIKNSALLYRDIFRKSRTGEDAIWLLPDSVAVDNKIILPLLLKNAWNSNVLLFSSNPAHVKRGALFAMFPDNKRMGVSLMKMAESYTGEDVSNISNAITPLHDLQAAINVRTAEHIGLTLSNEERKGYALVFPAP